LESRLLNSLGKIAGLAGIFLGIFLLLFQGVLQKQFLPQAGLGATQAFAVILSLMILTFGIAGIGVLAWLISRNIRPERPIPGSSLGLLAALIGVVIALVLGSAVFLGQPTNPDPAPAALVDRNGPANTRGTGNPPSPHAPDLDACVNLAVNKTANLASPNENRASVVLQKLQSLPSAGSDHDVKNAQDLYQAARWPDAIASAYKFWERACPSIR
jgi:hypothetical protein